MAGSQDAWRINGEDRSKHDAQFYQLKPVNGFVTGTQARDFFVQSGLPTPILGQIWTLADMNGDGKMDKKEFSIAMHLIKKKLQGYELPKVLPASLKADPTPVIGSFAQPGMGTSMNIGFPMGGMPASMGAGMGMQMQPMIQPQASLGTATMTTGSLSMGPRMANGAAGNMPHPPGSLGTMPLTGGVPIAGVPGSSAPPSGGSIWAMPHNSKLKHTQVFNANDRNKRGYLLGVEARALLMQSGLPQNVLAQIWTLSDIDRDGKLTCDEFCIAMHLSELARMGHTLPPTLPPELLPSKARSGSLTSPPTANLQGTPKKDAFGDLLGSSGIPQPGSAVPAAPQTAEEQAAFDEQVTFEDRRKENFDKGQAELERRRAILREQQKKEENERLEKERQEAEKRERQRQEAESKRQAELQRQLERQREKEREIEEQRRKMMEQREAARRELERQRQMEWEKQRKEQLMAERQRELEQLSMTKSRMANLKNELESLDAKKAELSLKVTQVQKGVTDFTTSIDAMRVSRDRTLADIDLFERQSMELNKKLSTLGGEKERLNIQVQTAQSTPLSDLHRTVSHSIETKKASIQQLKKQVEQLESDTEARLGEIDCNNAELKNMKDQLAKLERDLPQLQKQQDDKIALQKKAALEMQQKQRLEKEKQEKIKQELQQQQKKAPSLPASTASSNSDPSWFDFNSSEAVSSVASAGSAVSWDTAFSGTTGSASQSTSAAWGVNGTKGGTKSKMKYRALYDFAATRDDELTLIAGTEVWVLADVTPVPGMEDWYKGENEGKIGWFPKAYVEALEEPSTDLFGSAFEPVVSTSAQKTESSKTDIFNSNFSQSSAISNTPTTSSSDPTSTSHIPPEGLLAKATYPWKARQDTDLTFDKDDVILVKEKQDMKWFGELNGKSGWFPKAYVKLIGVASKAEAPVDKAPPSQLNTDMKADTSSVSPAPLDGQGEYYIAMYTYQSDEPSDLNFSEGEMILVTAASGDWWTGTLVEQGKTGIFPATYVKKLEIQPGKANTQTPNSASSFDSFLGDFGGSSLSSAPPALPDKNKVEDLFGSLGEVAPQSSSTNALGGFDMPGITFGGTQGSPASQGASLSTETKPTQSLSPTFAFDGFGVSDSKPLETPSNKPDNTGINLAPKTQKSDDLFAGFDSLGFGQEVKSLAAPAVAGDQWNLDPSGSTSSDQDLTSGLGAKKPTSMQQASFSPNSDASDPFGAAMDPFSGSDPFGSEDPFGGVHGFAEQLGKPGSMDQPAASKTSEAVQNLKANASFIDSLTKPGILDLSANSSFIDSLRPTASLPDVGALEKDAMQLNSPVDLTGDLFGGSLGLESKGNQVDAEPPRTRSGSRPAPPAPRIQVAPAPEPEPKNQMLKKPEIARVIAPYVATGTGQLSLETGNLINVRQKSPRGWWEGELQVRGQKKKIGWFPANYVKLLGGSSARSTPEPTAAAQLTVTGAPGSRSATPQSTASQDGVTAINNPETVVALYPYAAQNEDELTFQKDSVITVLSRDNPDWWSGQLDGQTGVFPSNYVTPNPQSMSWMNDTQGTLSKAERKRQQAIQELINTEETYNSDMQIALEVFKQPLINNSVLPKDQVNQIFVNWEELIVCNKKFLQALRVRKKMCGKNGIIVSIGDILCESLPHMNPYMRFCSCQLSAAATLQRVSENIPAFQEFHKATMRDSRVKGVHLSGYLLKPMQRITRYPLLIEKILGSTPDDHADRGNLEEALNLAQELCSQANQCVKEKQNSDSLEWIQANVHCDGLAENIIFNSLTNCLGPRRLLFHGILYKAKSNKELVGFLFNDFLMLAHTSRQLGPTFSTVHLFDTSTQFKMYRMPIFLNEVSVKKPTEEADPTLFHITSDRIINLKAISAIERDTWVREIEAASKQYKDKAKRKLERAHSVSMRTKPVGRVLVVVEEGVGLRPALDAVKRPNVGRILVVIQEACHLKASDANGKSDPYCEVSMGSQEHRTKVISSTLNPRWNASMQFMIRDVDRDTLCFTIYDRDLYSPNDFLGRTEVRIRDVLDESGERRGPITRRLILHEVETGEVVVKLDLQLFESS